MIKLVDLLEGKKEEKYPPYMYSPVGFGCHVCEYYYMEDDNIHKHGTQIQQVNIIIWKMINIIVIIKNTKNIKVLMN